MNLNKYADWQETMWRGKGRAEERKNNDVVVAALGLAGEAGEVIEHFKKFFRDDKEFHRKHNVALELGDVAFYWVRLCRAAGYEPEEILDLNIAKLEEKFPGRK